MADRILDSIESPNMLALLTDEELAILAGEIRDEILNTTSQTGAMLPQVWERSRSSLRSIALSIPPKISSSSMWVINPMRICSLRVDAMNSLRCASTKAFQVFRNRTPIRMMFTLPGMHPTRFRSPAGLRGRAIFRGRSRRSLRSSAMPLLLAAWRSRP